MAIVSTRLRRARWFLLTSRCTFSASFPNMVHWSRRFGVGGVQSLIQLLERAPGELLSGGVFLLSRSENLSCPH
ncbi:hypothetical protein EYF80_022130 [Liparis tanakae]|uniref:Uncharacterized protein n=1 Tax=Liparis tanakae TaxID=230148 RepID=A0A4Z2HP91_9TELE|nr:hypothetical protein EYF80_022130 [Liparis tanakae]